MNGPPARSVGVLSGSARFTRDEPDIDDDAGARTLNG